MQELYNDHKTVVCVCACVRACVCVYCIVGLNAGLFEILHFITSNIFFVLLREYYVG